MLLGNKNHTAGNTIRYEIDYSDWLDTGDSLVTATVTGAPAGVTISGVVVLTSQVVAFVMAGGVVNTNFTLAVAITDTRGEIKNDTIGFAIQAP